MFSSKGAARIPVMSESHGETLPKVSPHFPSSYGVTAYNFISACFHVLWTLDFYEDGLDVNTRIKILWRGKRVAPRALIALP